MIVTEVAPAKVNLFLRLTGRRGDGYHLLDSLVVFAAAADTVAAAPAEDLALAVEGPFGAALAGADNLVLRAARALAAAAGIAPRARLTLTKRLPVAAGLGGGSADAAATLRALDRLWGLGLGPAGLAPIAAGLGADVPVCLAARPARVGGIGERLAPAPTLPRFGLLLANPGVPLATAAVFAAWRGSFAPPADLPAGWADAAAMAADLAPVGNALEPAARALCPAIAAVLDRLGGLAGVRLVGLSGSGPTCFALFDDEGATAAAAARLAAAEPGWWIAACAAGGDGPPAAVAPSLPR